MGRWETLGKVGAILGITSVVTEGELGPAQLRDSYRAFVAKDPMQAAMTVAAVGSLAFYRAEVGHNPKVRTLGDAFVFITTCMSVGYSDIFAKTEAGKAIASAVMTVGPALAASFHDGPTPPSPGPSTVGPRPEVENARLDPDVVRRLLALLDARSAPRKR